MKARIAVMRSLTDAKLPHRMACRVVIPKNTSTRFSHDPPVGGEVQLDPPVVRQPLADLGMLVGAVVVAHDVQLAARVGGGDLLEEAQELPVAMPREAGCNDLAGGLWGATSQIQL